MPAYGFKKGRIMKKLTLALVLCTVIIGCNRYEVGSSSNNDGFWKRTANKNNKPMNVGQANEFLAHKSVIESAWTSVNQNLGLVTSLKASSVARANLSNCRIYDKTETARNTSSASVTKRWSEDKYEDICPVSFNATITRQNSRVPTQNEIKQTNIKVIANFEVNNIKEAYGENSPLEKQFFVKSIEMTSRNHSLEQDFNDHTKVDGKSESTTTVTGTYTLINSSGMEVQGIYNIESRSKLTTVKHSNSKYQNTSIVRSIITYNMPFGEVEIIEDISVDKDGNRETKSSYNGKSEWPETK
jgi:hypothetical protein